MNLSIKEVEDRCKKKLRLTKQLRIILNVIYNSDDHPNVDTIFERAVKLSKSISKATIYRCLKKLVEIDVVEKQDFGLGRFHYEIVRYHHHHLIDTTSGRIIEFTSPELEELKKKIAKDYGFELINERLDLYAIPIKDEVSTGNNDHDTEEKNEKQ